MIDQDQVLQIVSKEGPLLPAKISKSIGTNLLFAAAVLSELVSNKKLKVSNVKIGSSPLYYKPGQESRLQNFAAHLDPKDKNVFDVLRAKKVMRDSAQEPLTRVALRQIKDFAVPLEVTFNNEKEIFWKWYLLPNEEAEGIIKKLLDVPSPEDIEKKKRAEEEQKRLEEERKKAEEGQKKEEEEKRRVEEEQGRIEEERKKREEALKRVELQKAEGEKRKLAEQQRRVEEDKKKAEFAKNRAEDQQKLEMDKFKLEEEKRILDARKKLDEERRKFEEEKQNLRQEQLLQKQRHEEEIKKIQDQKILAEKEEEKRRQEEKDPFFKTMTTFFSKSKINVFESQIVKKKSEIEFLIGFESAVGNLNYYCIAKDKKRVSDSDLNAAFVTSQLKKLPTILFVTGELTKKAKEMLGKEFKGLSVKKI